MSKKVCILTTFVQVDEAYSLIGVVQNQIRMLVSGGYNPVVVVKQGFTPQQAFALPQVELRYIPNVPCSNFIAEAIDENFKNDVKKLKESLNIILDDVDVILTHDLIYQPESLKLNFASRQVAKEKPHIRWLHWIHSATSPQELGKELGQNDEYFKIVAEKFPNSFVVFPNAYSIPRVAKNFGYEEDEVKVVHHATNLPGLCKWNDEVTRMYFEKRFYEADVIDVYPLRLDRGKQPEIVIKIMAQLKKLHKNVKVVIADFHSTGGDKVLYREQLKKIGEDWGLTTDELIFTSEFTEAWKHGAPNKVVHDLFEISNVFIMPSKSETYSLVVQEAGMLGNLLVLNQDFAPFRDIYGKNAIYKQFSSNIAISGYDGNINTSYNSENPDMTGEQAYFHDTAMRIKYEMDNNIVLSQMNRLRKLRNPINIFNREMEPLLFAD